jgi:hypothetical protein
MMAMACILPIADAIFSLSSESLSGPIFDQELFHLGRRCGALHFSAVYSCIMIRLLIGTRSTYGKFILPALGFLTLLAAAAFLFFIKFAKQETDSFMGIIVHGFSIRQFAQGLFSMMPTIGFIMILTPILIPSVYISRIGELFGKDLQTGSKVIDEYLKFSHQSTKKRKKASFPSQNKTHLTDSKKDRVPFPQQGKLIATENNLDIEEDERPEVLLVEDDLACAALVLKFFKKLKLECIHVESLDMAQQNFNRYQHCLKILILDNFVRLGETIDPQIKTGSQWAAVLNKAHPKPGRSFHIAILSGHTHLLAELSQEADLVLQKPWDPRDLFRYLKDQHIV